MKMKLRHHSIPFLTGDKFYILLDGEVEVSVITKGTRPGIWYLSGLGKAEFPSCASVVIACL
jgi:hypothetical protein